MRMSNKRRSPTVTMRPMVTVGELQRSMAQVGRLSDPRGHADMWTFLADITVKGKVLEPLADLCGSTRRDLLKSLREILEDRDALALLGETLDRVIHGEYERPQTEVVASFMDQLDVSKVSKHLIEAVDLLISALDALPDNVAALLAKCGPETLNCISNMITSLKDGQVQLPESPLLPLQEKEELHWVAKFIISANDLEGLKKTGGCPHFSPEGLLELLYISVVGLIVM